MNVIFLMPNRYGLLITKFRRYSMGGRMGGAMYMKSWVTIKFLQFYNSQKFDCRRPPPFGRGGLGVFAFQDVPVRRFAPSSLYLRFILLFHLTSGVTGSAALKHGFLSHRLLRMNVQGCHYILAICLHIEFETMTASGPVHHPSNTYFFRYLNCISFM